MNLLKEIYKKLKQFSHTFLFAFNIMNFANRFEFISLSNPVWAEKLYYFVETHPEFKPYKNIAPSTDKPVILNQKDWFPKNIFEHVIYYACFAGVNTNYATLQFQTIISFIRSNTWEELNYHLYSFLNNNSIQPKKKQIYQDIVLWMGHNKVTNSELTLFHIEIMQQNVKGLGPGFLSQMRGQYSNSDNCIEYTDIKFKGGFKKIYGTNTTKEIKTKVEQIISEGYGRIFNAFIFQIFYYA